MRRLLRRIGGLIDPYIIVLFGVVGLAALLPARGPAVRPVELATQIGVGVLFFLYGARLSNREALDGVRHWRLHLLVLALTFLLFPALGIGLSWAADWVLPTQVAAGVLFLSLLPSTVQSSVAFTSIAHGNVAASICAASFSNLAGVVVTPLLVIALMGRTSGGFSGDVVQELLLQLLAPFLLGQLVQRWIGNWLRRRRRALGYLDRGAILLVVYAAFSAGMREDMWELVSWQQVLILFGCCVLLLTVMMVMTALLGRWLKFSLPDRRAIFFAGSKKSMASGLPMATILFPAAQVGIVVLPLMLFHQLQLIVCAQLARRWAKRVAAAAQDEAAQGGQAQEGSQPSTTSG